MTDRRQFITAALLAASGLPWQAARAAAATADLDPRQAGRPRAGPDDAAIR
ncbi:ABC transporter substrate-binding protein, partial [Burkholderia sp. IO2]|nr:ABC transporter substrate-binding protein [Burkholderia sp. IO2]